MNPKIFIIIFLLLTLTVGVVYGGENITNDSPSPINIEDINDATVALEDGHLNTGFSNNMTGYCVEYGEQEASIGDKYYITNTSHDNDFSNHLKVYFIDHYNLTQKDKIVTQHTIWHFTDGFNGWRINYTLVDEIKKSDNVYGDEGVKRWNDTHEMVYKFRLLLAQYEHHQNYFAYNIYFRPMITEDDNQTSNSTLNNTIVTNNTIITNGTVNETRTNETIIKENITNDTYSIMKKQAKKPHHIATGNNTSLLYCFISIIIISLIIKSIYGNQ